MKVRHRGENNPITPTSWPESFGTPSTQPATFLPEPKRFLDVEAPPMKEETSVSPPGVEESSQPGSSSWR